MDPKTAAQGQTRLGQILIGKKLISNSQLDAAMREQDRSGRRLGEILADMKLITQAQVQGAIRRQRLLRLAAGLAAAFLGPAQAYAAGVGAVAAPAAEARPFGDDASRAWSGAALDQVVAGGPSEAPRSDSSDIADASAQNAGLRMQALDDTNALAMFQHAAATAQAMQQGTRGALSAGVRVAGDMERPSAALAGTLALTVNVSQVTTGPGTVYAAVGRDGGLPPGAGGKASVDLGRIGGKSR